MAITISGTTGIAGVDGSAGTPAVQGTDTNTGVFYPAADTVGVSTGGSERMRVDSSGNVGIGTSSPNANSKLDVAGISQSSNASYPAFQLYNSGLASNAYFRIAYDAANNLVFNNVNNAYNSSTEFMRINSSGNVGIGTSSPSVKLHVLTANPTAANEVARFQGGTNAANFRNYISLYTTNPNYWWEMSNQDSSGTGATNGFAFIENSAGVSNTRVYMASGGNVGIGTSSPSYRLHVANSSATSTTLLANILARLQSNASGADASLQFSDNVANSAGISLNQGNMTFSIAGGSAAQIDTSANFKFNSGYGSVATAYGCRAWVNFNGTGTVAIRASGNVSSITDNGTGNYTVNFTTAMPDANYSVTGSGQYDVAGSTDGNSPQFGIARENPQPSVSAVRTRWVDRGSGISLIDPTICCVAIFR